MMNPTITATYENGAIRIHGTTIRLGRKLPLRNRARLSFVLLLPQRSVNPVTATRGIIRVPKRLARLIAESPEFDLWNS